jgi:hypothetical protein
LSYPSSSARWTRRTFSSPAEREERRARLTLEDGREEAGREAPTWRRAAGEAGRESPGVNSFFEQMGQFSRKRL